MTEPIQQWKLGSTSKMLSVYGADGDWVRYDCHLAVIAAAEARIWSEALDAAREAVLGAKAIDVASGRGLDEPAQFIWLNNALSAIDALRKDSND